MYLRHLSTDSRSTYLSKVSNESRSVFGQHLVAISVNVGGTSAEIGLCQPTGMLGDGRSLVCWWATDPRSILSWLGVFYISPYSQSVHRLTINFQSGNSWSLCQYSVDHWSVHPANWGRSFTRRQLLTPSMVTPSTYVKPRTGFDARTVPYKLNKLSTVNRVCKSNWGRLLIRWQFVETEVSCLEQSIDPD